MNFAKTVTEKFHCIFCANLLKLLPKLYIQGAL